MSRISEKIKVYITDSVAGRHHWTHNAAETSPEFYTLRGVVEVLVEYEESDLVDPSEAAIAQAEAALEVARKDFRKKEQELMERIQSLRALPHIK